MNFQPRPLVALDVTSLMNRQVTGIQRVVLELVPRLARACFERGLEVALVASGRPQLSALVHWPRPVAPEKIHQVLSDISTGRIPWGIWHHAGKLTRRCRGWLQEVGFEGLVRRIPAVEPAGWLLRRGIDWLAAGSRPLERVHYYLGFSAGILPQRLPPNLPCDRAVLILHDLIPLRFPHFVRPQVTQAFVNNIRDIAPDGNGPRCRFLTASTQVASEIRTLFWELSRQNVSVGQVAWGYDRTTFYPDPDPTFRQSLGIPANDFLVLAVSTQDPRKRFGDIEKAISLLGEQRPVHGVFIGTGPKRTCRHGSIRYLGHLPDDLLRRAYSSCDVFVNWSAAEGFGLPVIEALACGAPGHCAA